MRRRRDIYQDISWCEARLPYCARRETSTGHILLLDRKYRELWVRADTDALWADMRHVSLIDRGNGVFVHFWNDARPPWIDHENRARCHAVLRAWGVSLVDPFCKVTAKHHAAFSRTGGTVRVPRHMHNVVRMVDWQRSHGPH